MITGDFVRVNPGWPRMVITGFVAGFAVVEGRNGFRALSAPSQLIPAPYRVRGGIVYDGEIPVGVF